MCIVDTEALGKRIRDVQRLLSVIRPLHAGHRRAVPVFRVNAGIFAPVIIAAAESKTESAYRDWLFRTSCNEVWAQYAEEWEPLDDDHWQLRQVGLQLYLVSGPGASERQEIFALHSEPLENGETLKSRCKKGPHVHVTANRNLLSHAHIPLCLSTLPLVTSSVGQLTSAFDLALELVDGEILEMVK